jgi:hypothetical protein
MNREIIKLVNSTFPLEERDFVLGELNSLTVNDVMKKSEKNLLNAHMAILKLSDGDASQISRYVTCAKKDFRDVIYWASDQ